MRIVCLNDELRYSEIDELRDRGYDEIIYYYTDEGYEGYGQLLALHMASDRIYVYNLGHCSCYGPIEDGPCSCYTYEELEEILYSKNVLDTRDLIEPIKEFLYKSVAATERRICKPSDN